jgi:hypothetical protein
MLVEQQQWTGATGWTVTHAAGGMKAAQLVLFFGARELLADGKAFATIRSAYPEAHVLGCSTAGEICGTQVSERSIVATALRFEHSRIHVACRPLSGATESGAVGEKIARKLVLRQRVEEELESVRSVLGDATVLSGFYSYGEVGPFSPSAPCELHNQTMSITTFAER